MKIGFIGNFEAPYSTENDRKWSLMMLGHDVLKFQENKTSFGDLKKHAKNIDMLVYSHTHGWNIQGLPTAFSNFKKMGVPTVSIHLDRWAWLKREKDVGKEATWFTEYYFMADCSPEAIELYKKNGLDLKKVFYLPPGATDRFCYQSAPDPIKFPHEIIFTGSKGYHKEYPFRPKLVEWLHKTYGDRFGHYGDDLPVVRGHDLNVLYATAKIVVGDSCFGGRPYYVSDRYYEVRGRNGFLLHPHVRGVDTVGVVHYKPENLDSLKSKIDYYLENEMPRERLRNAGFIHVKNNEAHVNRSKIVIERIFNGK